MEAEVDESPPIFTLVYASAATREIEPEELESILEWIRSGGLLRAEELAATSRRERERHRLTPRPAVP